ncbi:MAG: hypothetical protein QGG48_09410 [Desulfatiglandales bacterium]|nr:hypothetical protein [Desulfatiglandales bacterium]
MPEEVEESDSLSEGAVRPILVNAYGRNQEAHQKCIKHYGVQCVICDFDIRRKYGDVVEGLIHVHHLRELSEIGKEHKVDPI